MAKKRDSDSNISDKFSSLIHAKPNFFDEDDDDFTKVDEIIPNEKNSDYSADELDLVQFRKLNIEFLDAEDNKYCGKKSSRVEQSKAFDSDSSDVEDSTDENIEQTQSYQYHESGETDGEDDDSVKSECDNDGGEALGSDVESSLTAHEMLDEDILVKSSDDIKKGNAIRNQLLIWDLLLECRMKFQKCLISSNQLPNSFKLHKFMNLGGQDFEDLLNTTQTSVKHLLNSLLELQDILLNKNEEYKKITSKHRMSSDEESEDQVGSAKKNNKTKRIKLLDFSNDIEGKHKEMEIFRNETIQKWNDRTRIAHLNSKNFNAFEQSTLKQIQNALLDKVRLIKRTQIKRSNYHILGQSDEETPTKKAKIDDAENASVEYSNNKVEKKFHKEIFDDDDFYHQLLNEYIKRKSFDVSDPIELSKQWIQLEKIRSKMKKKVDTRATKGRKIRYVVHPKLVNFMMPIDNDIFNKGSRFELFNSLFGKKNY